MKYPYKVMQTQDVTLNIGFLTINGERVKDAPTTMVTKAGYRQFRTKKSAAEFIQAMIKDYGPDVVRWRKLPEF